MVLGDCPDDVGMAGDLLLGGDTTPVVAESGRPETGDDAAPSAVKSRSRAQARVRRHGLA
jgi:hypothetical protein